MKLKKNVLTMKFKKDVLTFNQWKIRTMLTAIFSMHDQSIKMIINSFMHALSDTRRGRWSFYYTQTLFVWNISKFCVTMGARVSRTDFEWSYTDEPHATRRRQILSMLWNTYKTIIWQLLCQWLCLHCYRISFKYIKLLLDNRFTKTILIILEEKIPWNP